MLILIREVLGSNLSPDTDLTDGFRGFSQKAPDKCWDITSIGARPVLFKPFPIPPATIRRCKL
jgi:hypothetical protein